MKKYEIYLIEIILFISIIMFNIVYKSVLFQSLVFILLAIYSVVRFGFMKDNNYLKKSVTKMVISCILIYLLTIYILGLILGFNKTPAAFSLDYFIKVISFDALIVISEEIIRYIIARNTPHKKLPIIIYTLILIILNIVIEISGFNFKDSEQLFIFITTIIIPTISRQALCSYLTYKVSYVPALIFNLFASLYSYVFPIIPRLGNYLFAVTSIALPFITYYTVSKLVNYKEKVDTYRTQMVRRLIYLPLFVLLIIMVMFVSGIFSHTMIAVGTGSMAPVYERGDAIIYKKVDIGNLKEGQIIAFKKEGKIVTHRIVKISKRDKDYIIKTKGDANNAPDSWEVKEEELLGVVNYRIKYLGYPTLWFNDIYNREETE